MRMIDSDVENSKLLDFIAEHDIGIQYALEHKDMTMLEEIFFEYFESQKTTYDVEKVIENLKNRSQDIALIYTTDKGVDYEYADGLTIDWAIDIVKAGGVETGK